MKATDVHNEVLKARAGVLNALAVGAVAGGALQAFQSSKFAVAGALIVAGFLLHLMASQTLEVMRTDDD